MKIKDMKTSISGVNLIKQFEGCELTAYICPAGVPTIGYGNTYYLNGSKVSKGDKITQKQADDLLMAILPKYENIVKTNVKVELNQNQFDALVSFCWNCGKSNNLFRLVNLQATDEVIYKWWTTHYITGGGKQLAGLVKRRKIEAELFIKK